MRFKMMFLVFICSLTSSYAFAGVEIFRDDHFIIFVQTPISENSKMDLYLVDKADSAKQLAEVTPKILEIQANLQKANEEYQKAEEKDKEAASLKAAMAANTYFEEIAKIGQASTLKADFYKTVTNGEKFIFTYISDYNQASMTEKVSFKLDQVESSGKKLNEVNYAYEVLEGEGVPQFDIETNAETKSIRLKAQATQE